MQHRQVRLGWFRERSVMRIPIGPARLAACVFASVAIASGASSAAVVLPPSRNPGLQAGARRGPPLACPVWARAPHPERAGGGAPPGRAAVTSADRPRRLRTDRSLPAPFWGGPLFDARGHLAGLSTPPVDAAGTAIPASLLRPVLRKLLAAAAR